MRVGRPHGRWRCGGVLGIENDCCSCCEIQSCEKNERKSGFETGRAKQTGPGKTTQRRQLVLLKVHRLRTSESRIADWRLA